MIDLEIDSQTTEDEVLAKVKRFIAEEILRYTHIPIRYIDRAAERIVTFLKVEEWEGEGASRLGARGPES